MKFNSRRIASLGILTSIGLIMFIVEGLFPPLLIPGAKLGLSNVVTLFAVAALSPLDALIIVIARTVIGSFFVGSLSTLLYSLSAGLVSVVCSTLLFRFCYPKITLISISIAAATLHNLTQNLVYCLVTQTPKMLFYAPYLALLGVVAGLLVGVTVQLLFKYLPSDLLEKL